MQPQAGPASGGIALAADEQAAVAAGMNAMWGLRGLTVPFIGVWPSQAGLVAITGMLLLCAVVLAAGALLHVRARIEPAPAADRTGLRAARGRGRGRGGDVSDDDRGGRVMRKAAPGIVGLPADVLIERMFADYRRRPALGLTRLQRARAVWDRFSPALDEGEIRDLESIGRRAVRNGSVPAIYAVAEGEGVAFLGFLVLLADNLALDDA